MKYKDIQLYLKAETNADEYWKENGSKLIDEFNNMAIFDSESHRNYVICAVRNAYISGYKKAGMEAEEHIGDEAAHSGDK